MGQRNRVDRGRGTLGPPEAWDPLGEGQCGAQAPTLQGGPSMAGSGDPERLGWGPSPPRQVLGLGGAEAWPHGWEDPPTVGQGITGQGCCPRSVAQTCVQLPDRAVPGPHPARAWAPQALGSSQTAARAGLRHFPPQAAFQHPFSLDPRPQGRALSCRCVYEGNSAVLQGLVLMNLRVKWHSICHVTSSEKNRTRCNYVKMLIVVPSG